MKILITGGSGFIGTNILQFYHGLNHEVINVDFNRPQVDTHLPFWKNVDIRDKSLLEQVFSAFMPDLVIHLAARADLRGKTLEEYDTNILGVSNIMEVCNSTPTVKKVVFASSMLVCKAGYLPESMDDYCPPNLYGQSKVEGEKLVKHAPNLNFRWVIVRPSSIWGPWFGPTYRGFFELIIKKRFFNFSGKMAIKTYGYIGNAIYQIDQMVKDDRSNGRVFYLGDYTPTSIKEWAIEIGNEVSYKPITIPKIFVMGAAYFGDMLGKSIIRFPMNSFRLNNMITDNILPLEETKKVAPDLPFTRQEGNKATIQWMKDHFLN